MTDAKIELLRPQARIRCYAWLSAVNDLLFPVQYPGFKVHVVDTLRDAAAQAEKQAAGLSDLKVGWHNFGLAWDFAVIDDKGTYLTDGAHPAYAAAGNVSLGVACHYPITLFSGNKDWDHVEYHPGVTIAQMIAADQAAKDLTA